MLLLHSAAAALSRRRKDNAPQGDQSHAVHADAIESPIAVVIDPITGKLRPNAAGLKSESPIADTINPSTWTPLSRPTPAVFVDIDPVTGKLRSKLAVIENESQIAADTDPITGQRICKPGVLAVFDPTTGELRGVDRNAQASERRKFCLGNC